MRVSARIALTMLLTLGVFCAVAAADVFHLANGGEVEGDLLNPRQEPRQTYDVRTPNGSLLRLTRAQVRKFVPKSDERREYEAVLPRMPRTAEGNWTMAEHCLSKGLDEERTHHLHEVVRLDPSHREARLALGYTSIDGKWVLTDEWNRARGYVLHQGKWRTPQEIALLESEERFDEVQNKWKPLLKRLRSKLGKRDSRTFQAALAEIRAINNPLAGAALADMYEDEEDARVRKLWVEVLGQSGSAAGIDALVKAAVEDADPNVREEARDQLANIGGSRATSALLAHLKSKDNIKVNRAGAALARTKDPGAFLPLVEALITEHEYIVTTGRPQGNIGATFSPNGGTSFSPGGGGPKRIKRKVTNQSVLTALIALTPDDQNINYQYQQEKWKQWYADRHTPAEVNFRRDP